MSRPRKQHRHLPPCVYPKHGAYWLVRSGKWTRIGSTLTEALAEYARLHETPKGGMPALIERVLAQVGPKLAPSTRAQYRAAARKLSKILAEFSPEQVRPKHVAQIKVAMSSTPNMANRCISFLRTVFHFAVEQQLVESNPCIGVRRHDEPKRKRYLTDSEIAAIHGKAGPRLRVIIELHCLTGQRVVDVLKIRRQDLTADGIRFRQQKTGETFTIAWNPDLRAVIERANALYGNVRALTLLHNRRGKAPDYGTVALQWRTACEAAAVLDAQLRDLRARAITDTKKQGLNPRALAGHASENMTQRYIRQHDEPVVEGPSFRQLFDDRAKSSC